MYVTYIFCFVQHIFSVFSAAHIFHFVQSIFSLLCREPIFVDLGRLGLVLEPLIQATIFLSVQWKYIFQFANEI